MNTTTTTTTTTTSTSTIDNNNNNTSPMKDHNIQDDIDQDNLRNMQSSQHSQAALIENTNSNGAPSGVANGTNNSNSQVQFQAIQAQYNGQIIKLISFPPNDSLITNFNGTNNQNNTNTNNANGHHGLLCPSNLNTQTSNIDTNIDSKLSVLSNIDSQVYLMMPDMLPSNHHHHHHHHKLIAKSSPTSHKLFHHHQNKHPVVRDEKRRANHNEVERRRRDNINKWIAELSKVIPDCSNDHSKHGQSKGGILEKTVQYLHDMKEENERLCEKIRLFEKLKTENDIFREQNEKYKKENEQLKLQIESLTTTTTTTAPKQ